MNRTKTCIFIAVATIVPVILAISLVVVNRFISNRRASSSPPAQSASLTPTGIPTNDLRYPPPAQPILQTPTSSPTADQLYPPPAGPSKLPTPTVTKPASGGE